MRIFHFCLFVLLVALNACGKQTLESYHDDRISINNNSNDLNARVTYYEDRDVMVEPPEGAAKSNAAFKLKLKADVDVLQIDGIDTEASHVTIDGDYAYVSYFTPGNTYRGGAEIFDVHNWNMPAIVSQALLTDTDVSIILEDNGFAYLGQATDSDGNSDFDTPAALEVIVLANNAFTNSTTRVDLESYSANDIAIFDNAIHVTTGTTNGGLSTLSGTPLSIASKIDITGAKAVGYTDNYVVVMEGTGVNLHIYSRSNMSLAQSVNMGCSNTSSSKAEIDVSGDKVYASAWDCGMIVVDLATRTVVNNIAVDAGEYCYGVSVDGDVLYMAMGTAGLAIYEIDGDDLTLLGTGQPGGTTNFVVANSNRVFVADGEGGLKIMQLIR